MNGSQTIKADVGSDAEYKAAPWLVMIYLAGDTNLTEEMVLALQSLVAAGPPAGDKIMAQFDPSGMGLATQRYDLSKSAPTRPDGRVYLEDFRVSSSPEINTGSADALRHFIEWAHDRYGRDDGQKYRHLLILSGHGSGTTEDFLLRDENAADSLSIGELAEALEDATTYITGGDETRRKIDILGMDACFMSMFEVAYEIRKHVGILIGAEGLEPEFGWPYSRILAEARRRRPDQDVEYMTPRSLADLIVTEYVEFYSDYDRTAGRSADLAAIDLARMDDLGAEIDELAKCLTRAAEPDLVTLSHWSAQTYKADQFVDLHDFCMQAYKRFGKDSEVGRACADVIEGI